ncbi:snare domain-containing protein [Stagonosporopsis vannaccii]|nr:snare domain-containing protein [Stagonosporopsis vannaccii]
MSFQRSSALESQPTNWRREDDPSYADDPEFRDFASKISDDLFALTRNVARLSTEISKLGTKHETARVRERVKSTTEETAEKFKEIGEGVKKISQWPDVGPSQRFTQSKLSREFKASLTEFQQLQKQALEKERASASAARAALDDQTSPSAERTEFGQQQEQEQLRLANQDEVDFQESLIIERESEIRNIEQSVGELNELFRDVAHMVHEQGAQLDIIEENVEVTHDASRGAHVNLKQASNYQKSARNSNTGDAMDRTCKAIRAQLLRNYPFSRPATAQSISQPANIQEEPPLHSTLARLAVPDTVTIEIGPEPVTYQVFEIFLSRYSEYFKFALAGTWRETSDRTVVLGTDVESSTFNLFVEWLYTQTLPAMPPDWRRIADPLHPYSVSAKMLRLKLYVFADRFVVPKLRQQLNRAIVNDYDSDCPALEEYETITYAFLNLPSTDPILDLIVDRYFMVWRLDLDEGEDEEAYDTLPHEFLLRFYKRVGKWRKDDLQNRHQLFNMDFCSYHEHTTEQDKLQCPHKTQKMRAGQIWLTRESRGKKAKLEANVC